jgi:hypothetical protein
MRLEMAEFPVAEISLGSEFGYSSETLAINARELTSLILEDRHIKDASLEVVAPGARFGYRHPRHCRTEVKVEEGTGLSSVLGPVVPVGEVGRIGFLAWRW